jgi:hypothetical protein
MLPGSVEGSIEIIDLFIFSKEPEVRKFDKGVKAVSVKPAILIFLSS